MVRNADNRQQPSGSTPNSSAPSDSALRRALARARDSKPLDNTEAEILLHARGEQLTELLGYAGRVRDAGLVAAGRPGVITYSRKVFIPLTRLCRDRCGYCTFVTVPGRLESAYLSPDEVLEIARQGAALGCKEALFTLGDRPEARWPAAREWLDAHGYDDTLSYVRAMAIRVLEETGLLPHLNPGVLSWQDFQRLKPVAPSMGMMLETTSTRLFTEKGGPHFGSPDKDPAVRLRVLEDAGRSAVPFTTGILIGIGETLAERVDSIFAIRGVAREYGGVQEVIVQNFRAKPDTKMARMPDAELDDLAATIAVTRLVLGPSHQDPGSAEPDRRGVPADPGRRDRRLGWRLSADARPRQPGAAVAADRRPGRSGPPAPGSRCASGSRSILATCASPGSTPALPGMWPRWPTRRRGLANEDAMPEGRPWQEPDGGWGESSGRTDLHVSIDTTGRTKDRRDDFEEVYGDWTEIAGRIEAPRPAGAPERLRSEVASALRSAERDPAGLTDAEALALLDADGPELEALAGLADAIRRDVNGDPVTYVVNRNINFTNVCYTGCRFCAFAQRRTDADAYTLSLEQIGDRARRGLGGRGDRGVHAGRHPPRPAWHARTSTSPPRSSAACPEMHVHAFSPMEVMNGVSAYRPVGQGLAPARGRVRGRLAARHRRRDPRRRHSLGADQGQAADLGLDRGNDDRARAGHPDHGHDDVRARGHARALGRSPAGDPRDRRPHPRLHRVRAAAVRARQLADLPGRPGPPGPHPPREPRGARTVAADAARRDRLDPVLLGQARRRRSAARC